MFEPCYTIGWTRLQCIYLSTLSLERAATVRVIGFSKPKPGAWKSICYKNGHSFARLGLLNSRSGGRRVARVAARVCEGVLDFHGA